LLRFVLRPKMPWAIRLLRQDEFARRRHLQTIILLLVTNNDHPATAEKITARDRSLRPFGRLHGGLPISLVGLFPHCIPAISKQTPYPYFK
jgi:hypothetical protein